MEVEQTELEKADNAGLLTSLSGHSNRLAIDRNRL